MQVLCAGSAVIRISPLHFLAVCHRRQPNQGFVVLCLSWLWHVLKNIDNQKIIGCIKDAHFCHQLQYFLSMIYYSYTALIITSPFYLVLTYFISPIFTFTLTMLLVFNILSQLNSLDYIFCLLLYLSYHSQALNSLICADVPLSNYSLTHLAMGSSQFPCFRVSGACVILVFTSHCSVPVQLIAWKDS